MSILVKYNNARKGIEMNRNKKVRKNYDLEKEVSEVIKICMKLQKQKERKLVFYPPRQDYKAYRELVRQGKMVENPLKKNSYMFSETFYAIYKIKGKEIEPESIQDAKTASVQFKM